jgi:hypothetical protein
MVGEHDGYLAAAVHDPLFAAVPAKLTVRLMPPRRAGAARRDAKALETARKRDYQLMDLV